MTEKINRRIDALSWVLFAFIIMASILYLINLFTPVDQDALKVFGVAFVIVLLLSFFVILSNYLFLVIDDITEDRIKNNNSNK